MYQFQIWLVKMYMPTKTIREIHNALFKDGVLCAKKCEISMHPELKIPNLYVIKCMESLKSRGFVKEQFAWRHYYWFLTNEGIEFLRERLNLPQEVVPATLMKAQQSAQAAPPAAPAKPGGFGRGRPL